MARKSNPCGQRRLGLRPPAFQKNAPRTGPTAHPLSSGPPPAPRDRPTRGAAPPSLVHARSPAQTRESGLRNPRDVTLRRPASWRPSLAVRAPVHGTAPLTANQPGEKVVEAAGIEPASRPRTTPSFYVCSPWFVSRRWTAQEHADRWPAPNFLTAFPRGEGRLASPLMSFPAGRGQSHGERRLVIKPRENSYRHVSTFSRKDLTGTLGPPTRNPWLHATDRNQCAPTKDRPL